jgi:hypothetical protein
MDLRRDEHAGSARTVDSHHNVREAGRGELQILGTIDEPEAEIACGRDGELSLAAISIEAWQAIELARKME